MRGKINWNYKQLFISIGISLGVGVLGSFFTRGNMDIYERIKMPPLSPPTIVFPIVWTILYILMGVSAYIVFQSGEDDSDTALSVHVFQLVVNFVWTLVFFNLQNFIISFILIVILLISIIYMMIRFYKISRIAGGLQIPYVLWVLFATYLNLGIAILNL